MDKPYKGSGKKWEMPTKDDNYHRTLQDKPWRNTLKPLNIDQPEGPSFQVTHSLRTKKSSPQRPCSCTLTCTGLQGKWAQASPRQQSPSQGALADARILSWYVSSRL